ncbi:unnamed protein product [Dovyalis caffra]|uniref:Glycine zipper 2TM domain-containing protein n=1 Tax=Dovyalis caffra TaxID=77055 RepID=A0AAV1QVH2_9ROSI|nr:unnamed protein product [Dovyalis caffra]
MFSFNEQVGAILGVMVGALAGLRTKKGILHGAIAGAASGVILSKEILNLLLAMWDSDNTAMTCFFSLLDSISRLMSRRPLPQRFNPTKIVGEEKEVFTCPPPSPPAPRSSFMPNVASVSSREPCISTLTLPYLPS